MTIQLEFGQLPQPEYKGKYLVDRFGRVITCSRLVHVKASRRANHHYRFIESKMVNRFLDEDNDEAVILIGYDGKRKQWKLSELAEMAGK